MSKRAAGSGKNQRALPSARDLALDKVKVCRVPDSKHSALFFSISNRYGAGKWGRLGYVAECPLYDTRQLYCLPSVVQLTLGKIN